MKNWLIRTSNKYIFGPLSKSKVIELYENGSIQEDDEICSGNGFWFYIKEKEMVQKYLTGKEQQDFNPVSEALDVISVSQLELSTPESKVEETEIIDLNEVTFHEEAEEQVEEELKEEEIDLDQEVVIKKKDSSLKTKKSFLTGTVLNIFIFLLIIFALYIVYFRKRILKNIISQVNLISTVQAQTDFKVKKKDLL